MDETPFPVLVPGLPVTPSYPVARYRVPTPSGFARAALADVTVPGDLILELGIHEATYIREALDMKQRVLGLNVNPLPLLWVQNALKAALFSEVQAAFTRLGDLPKGTQPFIAYARDLYHSHCPTCEADGVAEWFAWDRDAQRPFAKRVHCPHCAEPQEGEVDAYDHALLEQFSPRSGPAYHIALGRAAPLDDPVRERAAELVALYTPRNLSLLMDIVHRLPQASSTPAVQRALALLVLEALDLGSSLVPYNEPLTRPRSLRPPSRFLENNIWMVMEKALEDYGTRTTIPEGIAINTPVSDTAVGSALMALQESQPGTYLLLSQPLRTVAPAIPTDSIAALLLHPQPPDATFWALSSLWATWLWKDEPHPAMHTFLSRRRLEWEWYRRSLTATLKRLQPLLKHNAPLLIVLPENDSTMLAHITAATAQAGFQMSHWIACPPWGYRLAFCSGGPVTTRTTSDQPLLKVLQRRGEPTQKALLEAVHLINAGKDAPEHVGALPLLSQDPAFTSLTPQTIWIATPARTARPLADRVEESVLRLLQSQEAWTHATLESAVYAQYCDELSPEPVLVATCIAAYTDADAQDILRLRAEDMPAARGGETRQMRGLLRQLGERLHFDVSQDEAGNIVWADAGTPLYLFRCTTTAALGPHLLSAQLPTPARRHLVLPGGRAALVALKLKRDPRLQQAVERDHWVFIKFRHLRRMAAEINQRSDIEVYLGLDPIVEQAQVQIPLPWQ
ncbi:MAG: hypothetical protein JXR84_25775 [Anaerolineae bacterium]|nr:hypothetical protein [Anaerolineae bacterium]